VILNDLTSPQFATRPMGRAKWGAVFASSEVRGAEIPRKPAILVVEDDHIIAMNVEAGLAAAGFEVIGIAASAEEAAEIVKARRPNLAVIDIRLLGDRDGIDVALDLLRDSGVRSLFATAHSDAHTRQRAEAARPLGWIAKPYPIPTLVRAVGEALKKLEQQ
jgi:DNA-binding NtrC family response regulator